MKTWITMAIAIAIVCIGGPATAQSWRLDAEIPAAVPLSTPQSDRFGIGGMPALGVYWGFFPGLHLGLRARGGALANRSSNDSTMVDPGAGGLLSATVALRAAPGKTIDAVPAALWLELAGGAAVTGDQVRPVAELAVGWSFDLGRITAGPSLRYMYLHQFSDPLDARSAHLALIGIDVGLSARTAARQPLIEPTPEPPPPPPPLVFTADHEQISDSEVGCPLAGPQEDEGCSLPEDVVVTGDRIILPDHVLFDTNRARVKHGGRKMLRSIVAAWRAHPEWLEMHVEGHADYRGPDEFNQWLSELRAQRVREVLIDLGIPGQRLTAAGFGATKPLVQGHSEAALQKNRRVEFVIITGPHPRDDD